MKIESLENRQLLAGADCPAPEEICPAFIAENPGFCEGVQSTEPGMVSKAWGWTGGLVYDKAVVPVAGYTVVPAYNHVAAPVLGKVMDTASAGAATVVDFTLSQVLLGSANLAASVGTGFVAAKFIPHNTPLKFVAAAAAKGLLDAGTVVFSVGTGVMTGMSPEKATEAALAGQLIGDAAFGLVKIPGTGKAAWAVKTKGLGAVSGAAGLAGGMAQKLSEWTAQNPQAARDLGKTFMHGATDADDADDSLHD